MSLHKAKRDRGWRGSADTRIDSAHWRADRIRHRRGPIMTLSRPLGLSLSRALLALRRLSRPYSTPLSTSGAQTRRTDRPDRTLCYACAIPVAGFTSSIAGSRLTSSMHRSISPSETGRAAGSAGARRREGRCRPHRRDPRDVFPAQLLGRSGRHPRQNRLSHPGRLHLDDGRGADRDAARPHARLCRSLHGPAPSGGRRRALHGATPADVTFPQPARRGLSTAGQAAGATSARSIWLRAIRRAVLKMPSSSSSSSTSRT